MPVRSIPQNSRSLTGKIIDSRRHTAVAFESALERDLYILLDFDPSVAHFEEQPVTIAYQDPVGVNRNSVRLNFCIVAELSDATVRDG